MQLLELAKLGEVAARIHGPRCVACSDVEAAVAQRYAPVFGNPSERVEDVSEVLRRQVSYARALAADSPRGEVADDSHRLRGLRRGDRLWLRAAQGSCKGQNSDEG